MNEWMNEYIQSYAFKIWISSVVKDEWQSEYFTISNIPMHFLFQFSNADRRKGLGSYMSSYTTNLINSIKYSNSTNIEVRGKLEYHYQPWFSAFRQDHQIQSLASSKNTGSESKASKYEQALWMRASQRRRGYVGWSPTQHELYIYSEWVPSRLVKTQ